MADDRLANAVVRSLSEYLIHRNSSALFDARLENLLNQVEVKLLHSYGPEMIAQFKEKPGDNVEVNTLRLHVARAIDADPLFARQLAETYGGTMAKTGRRSRWRMPAGALAAVVALGGAFLVGRTTASGSAPAAAPTTVTSTVQHTVTATSSSDSTSSSTSSTTTTPSVPGSVTPETPGDGSSLAAGTPVFLTDVPRPNNEWSFEHGDHDVQFTQYNHSLWHVLATCNSSARSREQQFRLKNFSRVEVKAVGTDSEADTGLIVRFDVLVNNDNVNAIASVVVNPGEAKELAADLPEDVFSLTLRMSLTRTDTPSCQRGNAVWGSPYVIAAGS